VHEIETGHEAMVTAPEELAGVLLELAGDTSGRSGETGV
jgi:hypothetical protein